MLGRMQKYRWIIFDADGTLFDYDRAELSALTRTFGQYELSFDGEVHRRYERINARLWLAFERGEVSSKRLRVERFEELLQDLNPDLCPSQFSDEYLLNLGRETALLPGAEKVVKRLSRDFDLMLATNGIAQVQHSRFGASSLKPYFKSLVISDEIGIAKPEPRFFSEVFARAGNPQKAEVLMVGDSLSSDIAGGVGFGIDTCWFNPSGQTNDSSIVPTYEIGDLRQIFEIVKDEHRWNG